MVLLLPCSTHPVKALPAASTATVLSVHAKVPYLHRIFSTVAGHIPRVVFGQGSQDIVVLLLPVQRGQHVDVTLGGGGWSQILHQFSRYLLSICYVPTLEIQH